ncbi:uncharacterized protein LOC112057581 [Bicyclus anynana]|uniref:Uncharacterized protein LOC112057581 n=1 Tax=Bicyclus anynana TaxID=110368 RepID=A0A6J1P7T0_BICAN|nr:uncharacterized protein LOC112057581 [Bicyclus anynana]
MTYNKHVANTAIKILNIYKQLAKTAKITWGLNPEIIRTIYVAVIEPIAMYAASVWAEASNKISVQKQLNAVQREFAQKISKSYRTVSLHAAMVLAGLLPLDLRIKEQAQLYEIKRGRPVNNLPADRKIESRISFMEFIHPSLSAGISYSCLDDLSPENIEKNKIEGNVIYTDGSKIEGKVGAAVSVWKSGAEIKFMKLKLEPYCSVFQAEMCALEKATGWILKQKDDRYCILSDSRSSLDLIKSGNVSHPLAYNIRRNIRAVRDQGRSVELFWIKAHVGIEGNERADALAKEAALFSKKAPDYSAFPTSYAKRIIRNDTLQNWQKRYTDGSTASTTKIFLPDVHSAYKTIRDIKINPIMTQVITGHGGFSKYLHDFKLKDCGLCKCDADKEEEPIHLLTECPRFMKCRYELEMQIDKNLTRDEIHSILKDKLTREKFINYATKIAKIIIKENKTKD